MSLLNVDVKVHAKALALCLELVLPNLVDPDQICFIKGWLSFFVLRGLMNVIYTHLNRWPLLEPMTCHLTFSLFFMKKAILPPLPTPLCHSNRTTCHFPESQQKCGRDHQGYWTKFSLYADDMVFLLSDLANSLPHVLAIAILSQYSAISGDKLNFQKSELFVFDFKSIMG